ncbi:MAG: hypothetical protein HYY49_04775 [Ignavibacteriales bacterium]|nr:hypothetical protein [Ignavibacteriales bacterium]
MAGKPVKKWHDLLKELSQAIPLNEFTFKHLLDVNNVAFMETFSLRKRLGVEVVMVERNGALLQNKLAARSPSRNFRDKIGGRCQFDVMFIRSLSAGIARRRRSSSGINRRSMSTWNSASQEGQPLHHS